MRRGMAADMTTTGMGMATMAMHTTMDTITTTAMVTGTATRMRTERGTAQHCRPPTP